MSKPCKTNLPPLSYVHQVKDQFAFPGLSKIEVLNEYVSSNTKIDESNTTLPNGRQRCEWVKGALSPSKAKNVIYGREKQRVRRNKSGEEEYKRK